MVYSWDSTTSSRERSTVTQCGMGRSRFPSKNETRSEGHNTVEGKSLHLSLSPKLIAQETNRAHVQTAQRLLDDGERFQAAPGAPTQSTLRVASNLIDPSSKCVSSSSEPYPICVFRFRGA